MRNLKKLIALLLCLSLLAGMVGCGAKPVETAPPTEPPTEAPTEPPAEDVYAEARAALDSAADISLELLVSTTITVAGQTFTEVSDQTLTYAGIGTDALKVALNEEITAGKTDAEPSDSEDEKEPVTYSEIYSGGTVYATLGDTYFFSGALTPEESAARYLPVVLLDAALYGSLTSETTGTGTTITFREPTAPESWSVPEGAEMLDASGSAVVSTSGALEQMNYTVTYQYGPAEITLTVESRPQASAAEITVPENTDDYPALQYVDALRLSTQAASLLIQAESASVSSLESIFTQAAGVMRNASTTMNLHGTGKDIMTKIESGLYLMDYSTNESQEMDQEETYLKGRYVATVDDGVPTVQTGIPAETIEEYCDQILLSHIISQDFWADVTASDLGSILLLEFTFTEDFGNTMQNGICSAFWEDPAFLNKLASAYVTNETTGYLAIDKFTSLPTAAGYYYEGTHTIDGMDYVLSMQSDQSIEAPGKGAYYEIAEEMPEEAEPEVKPTPLFYHVTGPEGQEMWLLGTIHVGDERTAYLPQEIYDAFAASDALALEINSKAFEEQAENDDKVQDQISNAYYYSGGKTLESMMEEADYAKAVQYMKASGNYNMNAPYLKAYFWSNSIDNFYLRQGYALHGDQGVEERLHIWAEELEKEIREVESSLFQIGMLSGFSDELQLMMLKESTETSAREYWEGTWELYELWCAGDEAALREELSDEYDPSELTEEELAEYEAQKHLLEEYNQAMSYDRNEDMLKVAINYLESGDVVFYAVGLAHLLNNVNGLVDALREAGYTVELVSYAQ